MTDRITPPAVIVGDQFAAGIAYKIPEAQAITRPGLSSDGLQALINSSATWSVFESDPWVIIATGTYDADYDAYQDLTQVRNKISYMNPEFAGKYPYVAWVLPLSNNYSRAVIKRVASNFGDQVFDMPQFLEATTQVPVTKPVYYPFPWSLIFGPTTVWYNQTTYTTSSTKNMLTDDNQLPNASGYSYLADAIRKATGNWTVKHQPPPPPPPRPKPDESDPPEGPFTDQEYCAHEYGPVEEFR